MSKPTSTPKFFRKAFLKPFTFACSALLANAAAAANTPYKFINPQSGLCLDLAGNNAADGTPFQLWNCNNEDPQRFYFDPTKDSSFSLHTKSADKCLAVVNASPANGTGLVQSTCTGGKEQDLVMRNLHDNVWALELPFSGKCVDVPGGATKAGTHLQQWECNGTGAQAWVPLISVFDDGGAYSLTAANSCLDAAGYGTAAGTALQSWGCTNASNQAFQFKFVGVDNYGSGYYNVVNVNALRCLDVSQVSMKAGAPVWLWDCLGNAANQQWAVHEQTGGTYTLSARHSALVLDAGAAKAGTLVEQQTANTSGVPAASQLWTIAASAAKAVPTAAAAPAAPAATAAPAAPATPVPGPVIVPAGQTIDFGSGADPSVIYFQGKYWSAQADGVRGAWTTAADSLTSLRNAGRNTGYTHPDGSASLQAPTLAVVNLNGQDTLLMYVSDNRWPGSQEMFCLRWNGADGWDNVGTVVDGSGQPLTGYDPAVVSINGRNYFFFGNTHGGPYNGVTVDVVEMSDNNPIQGLAGPVTLAAHDQYFDDGQTYVNEAPALVVIGNKVTLVYSVNKWDKNYSNAMRTLQVGQDPLNAANWSAPQQVFVSTPSRPSSGSGCFVSDGANWWWVYNYMTWQGGSQREMMMQSVTIGTDGSINLGNPR